jgi:hypothetical protein
MGFNFINLRTRVRLYANKISLGEIPVTNVTLLTRVLLALADYVKIKNVKGFLTRY